MGGVKGESRLMMDKEAGAKTRHVAVVVRRFQDTHSCADSLKGSQKDVGKHIHVQLYHS